MPKYYRENNKEWLQYYAVGEKPTGEVSHSGEDYYPRASVDISKPHSTPNFYHSSDGGLHPMEYGEEPDTLWTHYPAKISGAFSHTSMRHTIPVMIAMAKMQYPDLVASSDLSKHSSRLAQRGIERGLIRGHETNPDARVTNNIEFDDFGNRVAEDMLRSGYYEPHKMQDYEVTEARGYLRDMLRPRKAHTNVMGGPQFEHPQLPEVEW